jgi:hypothetical protein
MPDLVHIRLIADIPQISFAGVLRFLPIRVIVFMPVWAALIFPGHHAGLSLPSPNALPSDEAVTPRCRPGGPGGWNPNRWQGPFPRITGRRCGPPGWQLAGCRGPDRPVPRSARRRPGCKGDYAVNVREITPRRFPVAVVLADMIRMILRVIWRNLPTRRRPRVLLLPLSGKNHHDSRLDEETAWPGGRAGRTQRRTARPCPCSHHLATRLLNQAPAWDAGQDSVPGGVLDARYEQLRMRPWPSPGGNGRPGAPCSLRRRAERLPEGGPPARLGRHAPGRCGDLPLPDAQDHHLGGVREVGEECEIELRRGWLACVDFRRPGRAALAVSGSGSTAAPCRTAAWPRSRCRPRRSASIGWRRFPRPCSCYAARSDGGSGRQPRAGQWSTWKTGTRSRASANRARSKSVPPLL